MDTANLRHSLATLKQNMAQSASIMCTTRNAWNSPLNIIDVVVYKGDSLIVVVRMLRECATSPYASPSPTHVNICKIPSSKVATLGPERVCVLVGRGEAERAETIRVVQHCTKCQNSEGCIIASGCGTPLITYKFETTTTRSFDF